MQQEKRLLQPHPAMHPPELRQQVEEDVISIGPCTSTSSCQKLQSEPV